MPLANDLMSAMRGVSVHLMTVSTLIVGAMYDARMQSNSVPVDG
jgi:hypothetical protein